jgi:hypothetical protein
VLLRLAYLGVTNTFALLRLLPRSDRDKDAEILAHYPLPRPTLRGIRLLVRPDTVLKWHRDLIARRHAAVSRPRRPGRPRTLRSIRALVLRLAGENSSWRYRRVHGELLVLGVMVAPSTVWEILRQPVHRDVVDLDAALGREVPARRGRTGPWRSTSAPPPRSPRPGTGTRRRPSGEQTSGETELRPSPGNPAR